ncbi:TetR/AcrR family transcriptional regulator [Patulibacter sp. NPDC049589]|uniref:TetR/AcrR family transcriptional regulator n=1 Tax=Patulibacter sp. NPDC049589 TaxID=3154731 RepID=UPI003425E66F
MSTGATPTERPLRRDAARNRELLVEAAATVFAEQGLDAGVDEVARVAGVGVGTLYRRFPTKDALIDALVQDLLTSVVAAGREALARADGTGLESFLAYAAEHQARRRGCLPRLWAGDEVTEGLRREFRVVAAELLADAQAHGRVRGDLTSQDVSVVLWSIRGVIETTKDVAPDAWRRHLELLVIGLRPSDVRLSSPSLTADQAQRVTTPAPRPR